MALAESYASGTLQPVDRHEHPYRDFSDRYLFANRPVVLAGAVGDWNALRDWSPEFFRTRFGSRHVPVDGQSVLVEEFVGRVLNATDAEPAPYLTGTGTGQYLLDLFPELAADIRPEPHYLSPNWLSEAYWFPLLQKRLQRGPRAEIFFGGRGSGFPNLHWDSLFFHAFNAQVYGRKEWRFYGPDQTRYLYPRPEMHNQSQIENVFEPDLERFPLAAELRGFECTMTPGDLLFVPAGWWHTTRMTEPSISVAINSANASNWQGVRSELVRKARDKSRVLGTALDAYLGAVGARKQRRDAAAS